MSTQKVYKFEQLDCYRTGAALAIVAAGNGDQATKLMEEARKGGMQDFYGYNIIGLNFEAFDTLNPTEIPCLQTTLTKPTIIEIVEYNEG